MKTLEKYQTIVNMGVDRAGECLLWRGYTYKGGYGSLKRFEKRYLVHRVSYEKWHGEIPEGAQIDHICHNEAALRGECTGGTSCLHRRCVNPAHLRAVTARENQRSSPNTFAGGRARIRPTHCKRRHAFTVDNILPHKTGRYGCRECRKIMRRRSWTP